MQKRKKTQHVVIPRGTLTLDEVAVIEIPKRFQRDPVVIVKRRPGEIARARAESHFVAGPETSLAGPSFSALRQFAPTNQDQMGGAYLMPGQAQINPAYQQMVPLNMTMVPQISQLSQMQPRTTPFQPQMQPYMMPQYGMFPIAPSNMQMQPAMMYPNQQGSYSAPLAEPSFERPQNPSRDFHRQERRERETLKRSLDDFHKARRSYVRKAHTLTHKVSAISNSSYSSRSRHSTDSDSSNDSYY